MDSQLTTSITVGGERNNLDEGLREEDREDNLMQWVEMRTPMRHEMHNRGYTTALI